MLKGDDKIKISWHGLHVSVTTAGIAAIIALVVFLTQFHGQVQADHTDVVTNKVDIAKVTKKVDDLTNVVEQIQKGAKAHDEQRKEQRIEDLDNRKEEMTDIKKWVGDCRQDITDLKGDVRAADATQKILKEQNIEILRLLRTIEENGNGH